MGKTKIKELTKKEYQNLFKMLLKKQADKEIILEDNLLNITKRKSKRNSLKNRIRCYLQTLFSTQIREVKQPLNTGIGVRRKKFKNKEIIEVSNPQTDYKFFKRI